MPSGSFAANAAWLALAAITHKLTRAAGCLASLFHAKARTGTLRRHLITLSARIARRSRRITLHLRATGRIEIPSTACSPRPTPHHTQPEQYKHRLARPDRSDTVETLDRPAVFACTQPDIMIHNTERDPKMITQS
jgi:hypothetical protein